MLLVQVADARAETPALQAETVAQAERLEPGLLDLTSPSARPQGSPGHASGVNVGGKHQLGVIDRETALVDALDRAVAMIMPTAGKKPVMPRSGTFFICLY
jgi:hypothetical protein